MSEVIRAIRESGFKHDGRLVADIMIEHYGTPAAFDARGIELANEHAQAMGTDEARALGPSIARWVYLQILTEIGLFDCPDCKSKL